MKSILKKKRLLVSIIILIIVITLVACGFIFLKDKIGKKSSGKLPKNQLSEKEVNKISAYKAVKYASYLSSREKGIESFTPDELSEMIFWYGKSEDNDFKLKGTTKDDEEIYTINESLVTDAINLFFGPDASYDLSKLVGTNSMLNENSKILETEGIYGNNDNRQDELALFCGYTYSKYDLDNKTFELIATPGCGGLYDDMDSPEIHSKVINFDKAVKNGDELTVTLNAIYLDCKYNDDNYNYKCKIYKDNKKDNLIKKVNLKPTEGINIKKYLKKSSLITIKFKLNSETNEYYFVSSTIK
ncbi:MAG: hypothetical protein IKX00_03110 [Bacilli bacterium]|nr:hypothetical protein [Bacilli bacterium]